ncbi:MAG: alanine racemase [Pseudomonadota bacterium]
MMIDRPAPHPELAGSRITVDLGALVGNWRSLQSRGGQAEAGAVVKANAYGCGIEPVVKALSEAGCRTFFVAVGDEGLRVKAVAPEARCFILNGLFRQAAPVLADAGLAPTLGSLDEARWWAAEAERRGSPLPCAIHLDTGMERLGFDASGLRNLVQTNGLMQHLNVQLFMTHFACADDVGHEKTALQMGRFTQASALLPNVPLSCANSAAILQLANLEGVMMRPGIAMYGGEALNDVENPMQPVVTLEGRVCQIRSAKAGEAVGYGASETLTRDTRLAYVSVGYADGYLRGASNAGVPMRFVTGGAQAAFAGRKINGVGRISMDLAAFDITDLPEGTVTLGDWIELFGPTIAVDDVARAAGTIGYELLTGLSRRAHRVYLPVQG